MPVRMPPLLIVRAVDELEIVFARPWYARPPRLRISVAGLTPEEQFTWQSKLDGYARSCGCDFGAGATGLAILTCLVLIGLNLDLLWARPLSTIAGVVCFIGLSAGAGKGLGLLYARIRFRRTLRSLQRHLSPPRMSMPWAG